MTYDYEKDLPCIDLKPLRKEDFIKYLKDRDNWFLSEAMKQHPYLDKIYDQTVNTIRLSLIHISIGMTVFSRQRKGLSVARLL